MILGDGGKPTSARSPPWWRAAWMESVEDPNGDTALDVALSRGYTKIIELLS